MVDDVAEQVFRLDEVVAGVQVPVVLLRAARRARPHALAVGGAPGPAPLLPHDAQGPDDEGVQRDQGE
ncbi:hypothetical protein GCM10027162_53030 [Streptomyces incanus]